MIGISSFAAGEELGKTGGFPLAPFPLAGKGRRGHTLMKFFQKRAVAAVVLSALSWLLMRRTAVAR